MNKKFIIILCLLVLAQANCQAMLGNYIDCCLKNSKNIFSNPVCQMKPYFRNDQYRKCCLTPRPCARQRRVICRERCQIPACRPCKVAPCAQPIVCRNKPKCMPIIRCCRPKKCCEPVNPPCDPIPCQENVVLPTCPNAQVPAPCQPVIKNNCPVC